VTLAAGAIVTVAVVVTVIMPPAAGVDPVPEPDSGALALDALEARKLDADAEVVTGMMVRAGVGVRDVVGGRDEAGVRGEAGVRDEAGPEPLPGIFRTSPTLIWNAGPVTWGFAASRASRVIPLLCAIADI
jgi:hypothetical protein